MKTVLTTLILVVLFLNSAAEVSAQTLRTSFGETWGVNFPKGEEAVAGVPTTIFGWGMSTSIGNDWNGFADILVIIPRGQFHPSPRVVFGAGHQLVGPLGIGFSALIQWNPTYNSSDDSFMAGITAGPSLKIGDSASITFGIGWRGIFNQDDYLTDCLSFGPVFVFTTPL